LKEPPTILSGTRAFKFLAVPPCLDQLYKQKSRCDARCVSQPHSINSIHLPSCCSDNGSISGLDYSLKNSFCPDNSSAHSPSALTLVFQLFDQLSTTRFEGYYSDSQSFTLFYWRT